MNSEHKFAIWLVIAIALGITMVINVTILTFYKGRSADEWVKINSISAEKTCEDMGGDWFGNVEGSYCKKP